MCEMLGFTFSKNTDMTEYLNEFFSHSVKHSHGWGLMFDGEDRLTLKEPLAAYKSDMLKEVIDGLEPLKNGLAHIRFATVGSIEYDNCHPFTGSDISGREWTLIHNGTIYSSRHAHHYYSRQAGNTDSERFFLSMLDHINDRLEKSELSQRERFEMVNDFISQSAPRNKLNLIIYDGELLYIHKNLKNTLSFKRTDNGIIFSTVPLDEVGWAPFPMNQVIAYKDGSELYRGDRHKGEYIPTLEYITALDAMYI
jgi:glutamine amidotransferase